MNERGIAASGRRPLLNKRLGDRKGFICLLLDEVHRRRRLSFVKLEARRIKKHTRAYLFTFFAPSFRLENQKKHRPGIVTRFVVVTLQNFEAF
jgi:hypothetical protein